MLAKLSVMPAYEITNLGCCVIPYGASLNDLIKQHRCIVRNINLLSPTRFAIEEVGKRHVSLLRFAGPVCKDDIVQTLKYIQDKRFARYADLIVTPNKSVIDGTIICLGDSTIIHGIAKGPVSQGQELHLRRQDNTWSKGHCFLLVDKE